MIDKIIEFIAAGIVTPIIYLLYAIGIILLTVVFGLPIGIGIYFINMIINNVFGGI
jgi:hypothetical protein